MSARADHAGTDGWTGRPQAARAVRVLVALAPLPATMLSSYAITHSWSRPSGGPALVLWWLTLLASAAAVSIVVERLARRLLPLATLLRLSLAFPDAAPSRFRVALRDGNPKLVQKRLAEQGRTGIPGGSSAVAASLLGLVTSLGSHDRQTRGHSERVRAYSMLIGDQLGLDAETASKLQWAALLHDVGKMTVPAELLNKVEPLTDAEFGTIRTHPAAAARMLEPLAAWLGDWRFAATQHHERYDGRGYPQRLAGEHTALAARIVAVADAYDVMTTVRSYKSPMSHESARQELVRCAGSQFDPAVVRAFLAVSIGSLRRTTVPLAWLAQLSYLRTAATATMVSVVGAAGIVVGASMTPASASDAAAPTVMTTSPSTMTTSPAGGDAPAALAASGSRDPSGPTAPPTTDGAAPTSTSLPGADTSVAASPPPTVGPSGSLPTATIAPGRAELGSVAPVAATPPTTVPPVAASPTTVAPTTVAPTACAQLRGGATSQRAADLRGCDLRGLTLSGADLTGADLTGADLSSATLDQSSFNNTVLVGADLRGAHVTRVGFEHSDLTDARLDGLWADQVGFTGAVLRRARLSSMFLSRGNFDAADLRDVVADHLRVGGVAMRDANLAGARLDHGDLSGTGLDRAVFDRADLTGSDLRGATLNGTRFANAKADGVNLSGASGVPAAAAGATWAGATCANGAPAAPSCYP